MGCSKNSVESEKPVDVLLIGGGIMSATLGTYLNELEPGWTIEMVERLDKVAEESSNGWNNAGTGHSAFCELNYTSEAADGSMDISKAVAIRAVLLLHPRRDPGRSLFHPFRRGAGNRRVYPQDAPIGGNPRAGFPLKRYRR